MEYRQVPPRVSLLPGSGKCVAGTVVARGNAILTRNRPPVELTGEADSNLVLRARNGDLDAYSELVNRHQRAIYGIVSRMTPIRDDVDDLVQDIFITAYRAIDGFRGQSAFSTWLHSIAVNTTIKHLKKMKAKRIISIDDPDARIENTLSSNDCPEPLEAVEETERRSAVRSAIDTLSEKHRVVVILHYFEDHSCEEIAKILNCSVGTVWSRLHYACKKLRGQLDWLETA